MSQITSMKNTVLVGFPSGMLYSNFIMDSASMEETGTSKDVLDENSATLDKVLTNPGRKFSVEGKVRAGSNCYAEVYGLRKNDVLSINSIACCVEDKKLNFVAGTEYKATITLIKEDSMSYTA